MFWVTKQEVEKIHNRKELAGFNFLSAYLRKMAKHNQERFLNQQEEEQKDKDKHPNKSGQSL